VRNQEEVRNLLKPLHGPLTRVVTGAWEDWQKVAPMIGRRFARTPANVIYERMIARAVPELESLPGMHIVNGHQTVHFVYQDAVRFRFKKGDENGLSKNYPTQMALAFNDQTSDLFGAPTITRVDVVYQLDGLATRVTDVAVVARPDMNVLWSYSITASEMKSAEVVELIPKAPSPVESLVRPKVQQPEQEKSEGENS
jgi:hypothetical protein